MNQMYRRHFSIQVRINLRYHFQNPATCNQELEIFMDHAGRNCVLIEYVSNTSIDKLNDFHFMQLIKINYWLFDDKTHSGE